jgi:dienelactone hydrolase
VRVISLASANDVLPSDAASLRRATLLDLDATVIDGTLCSPLREYVLQRHEAPQDIEPEPAQRTVAAMFWQKTTAAVVATYAKRIAEWRALGLRSPLLVVVGPGASDPAVLDPLVLKLRKQIEKAGFDPDDAPVVSGEAVDATLLDALALALDERCVDAVPATSAARAEAVIANLERVSEEGRDEALIATAGAALRVYGTASHGDRRRILHAIFQGARTPQLATKAVAALASITVGLPRGGLTELARTILGAKAKLPSAFEQLMDYWRVGTGEREAMLQLLLETARAAPLTDRAKRCVARLAREGNVAMAPQLMAIIDELAARPAERAVFEGLLRAIEARQ